MQPAQRTITATTTTTYRCCCSNSLMTNDSNTPRRHMIILKYYVVLSSQYSSSSSSINSNNSIIVVVQSTEYCSYTYHINMYGTLYQQRREGGVTCSQYEMDGNDEITSRPVGVNMGNAGNEWCPSGTFRECFPDFNHIMSF